MANAYIFGTLLWQQLTDAAVLTDRHAEYQSMFLRLINGLKQAMMCEHCRDSFNVFMTLQPPEPLVTSRRALEMLWWLHNQVNLKLERKDIVLEMSLERVQLRASVWTSFGSLNSLWDLVSIMAIVPRTDPSVLTAVLDTIRVLLWYGGAHPGYHARALLQLAEAPAPATLTEDGIFRWVCQQRAVFYRAPENYELYQRQYAPALVAPSQASPPTELQA